MGYISIYDFMMKLCVDASICEVEIFSIESGDVVWTGNGDEIPDKYGEITEFTFDVPEQEKKITFNID